MNKVLKRLLVFFIGIPIMTGIIMLKYYTHLALNITVILCSTIAASEFYNMATKKYPLFSKTLILILTAILPFCSYNFILLNIDLSIIQWILVFNIFLLMGIESVFSKSFENSIIKIGISTLIIFYCGFIPTFISRMTVINEYSTQFILIYFLLVFMCDSGAWFFGMLFGKSTRGYFAASPNKSIVGFVGGIVTSIAVGILFKLLMPQVLPGEFWRIIIISAFTGLGAIIGDLIESVFKRTCEVKDSGNIIPGRGGLLDCMDSLLLGAPIYFMGVHFLYLVN